jgi:hypothetical protein
MPNILTASELRAVLGVSESLYGDVYLDSMIDSAEGVILPMLTSYQAAVTSVTVQNSVAYFTTQRLNYFVPGQDVIVTGCGVFDGTLTVTDDRVAPFIFTTATGEADTTYPTPFIPAGLAALDGSSAADIYQGNEPVKNAILVVSVEIFQSILAPGNTSSNIDFVPTPFVLGRSLQNRVIGLLSPFLDVENMAM